MAYPTLSAPMRRYCRFCGALAVVGKTLCVTCEDAEVRARLRPAAKRLAEPEAQDVQAAYAASLAERPSAPVGYASAVLSGTAPLSREQGTLVHAQRFGATLAVVPSSTHAAEVFFSYSRRSFYLHVRSLLRAFDPRPRAPVRRRDADGRARNDERGRTPSNRALAKTLRLTRLYLQMEMVPLALKLDCSQSQVWHIETGNNVILHKWVERYADVFGLTTAGLYNLAAAIQELGDKEVGPKDYLKMFVAYVLNDAVPSTPEVVAAVAEVKEVTGAATHKPRKTASAKRKHPGTGYPMNRAIGQALRYVRLRASIDVPEFVATAGLSSSHVYNMECDRKTVGNHIVDLYAATCGEKSATIWALADEILDVQSEDDVDDEWLAAAYGRVASGS